MADMFRTRFWMLMTVLVLMLGPLLVTAGYGLYLRSGLYCRAIARHASRFLNAPVQIGSVVPLDRASPGFRDVAVWLPGQFDPIFTCKTAVVRVAGSQGMELELRDGRLEARTDDWDSQTIERLVATAFGHDFRRIRLRTVHVSNLDLVARRGKAGLRASGASGQVDMSGPAGRMDLVCDNINGVPATEPIRIRCDFEPGAKPLIRELSLSVPTLDIAALLASANGRASGNNDVKSRTDGPASPVHTPARQELRDHTWDGISTAAGSTRPQDKLTAPQSPSCAGWCAGNIVYRQKSRDSLAGSVDFSGNITDADLAVIGRAMGREGLDGIVNCTLDKASMDDGQIQTVHGRLSIDRLDLAGLFALGGLPLVEGSATLNLHDVRYEAGSVQDLLADAEVRDLEVEPLLQLHRAGTITGRLSAQVQKVKIAGGRLEELAGSARMVPPTDAAGTIDRSILEAAVRRFWKTSLPPVLPEKVPYADLGVQFHSEDGELHVEGVAGPDEAFVLVAQVGSTPMPLVPAPPESISLNRLQARLEAELRRLCRTVADWPPPKEPQP
jgi:hypothetical protein